MKKLPLHWRIITGMVLGVICGAIFTQIEDGNKIISDWIKPFGVIFINALKLIAMPLILGYVLKIGNPLNQRTQYQGHGD